MKKILCIALCLIILGSTPAFAAEGMSKGILLHSYDMLGDATELGCGEVLINITSKEWNSNKTGIVWLVDQIRARGMKITAVILKNADHSATSNYEIIAKSDMYYINDVATSLAGKIDRYIIGNEINSQEWSFAGDMETDKYCQIYAGSFADCYNAFKAASPAAEIYIPFNYGWYNESNNKNTYSGKEVLMRVASYLPREMDWGVAWHPYPDPLNSPNFMDDTLATDGENSYIVGFKNLHVLTDYLQRPEMRKADGSVRNVILSEQGFTSIVGGDETTQAEFFRQSWEIARTNPYVKAYLLSRQVDAAVEVANGWAFGLWNSTRGANGIDVPTTKKLIWEVFRACSGTGTPASIDPAVTAAMATPVAGGIGAQLVAPGM